MDLKEPRRKRNAGNAKSPLPLQELTVFHANLSALGTCIVDPTEMEMIYRLGYFGKGSLSKSYPSFGRIHHGAPPVIFERQWLLREEWINDVQKLSNKNDETKYQSLNKEYLNNGDPLNDASQNNTYSNAVADKKPINADETREVKTSTNEVEILETESDVLDSVSCIDEVVLDSTEDEDACDVSNANQSVDILNDGSELAAGDNAPFQGQLLLLPDSDSDTENYLKDIKPVVRPESFPVRETLHLTFEESFFLMYGLDCLRLLDFDGKFLSIGETWSLFCKEQKHFLQKYVVYHYFRSNGWVVKPGLKYGGEFLLYKQGPPFYHSSYIVVIDVLDASTFKRIDEKSMRKMSWNSLVGLERLAESAAKEVLIAQVLWPCSIPLDNHPNSPEVLSQFTVREVLWRRWKVNQNAACNVESDEDENST